MGGFYAVVLLKPGFRAFVIDDDEFSRATAVRIMRRLGAMEVIEAADGAAALRKARELGNVVDIFICDLRMPQIDGIEIISAIAADCPSARFVVTSSAETRLLRAAADAARRAGLPTVTVINKPITMAKMQEANLEMARIRSHVPDGRQQIPASQCLSTEEVAQGLANREFTAFYQPKMDIRERKIVGAEALVRWQHPALGLLTPGQFMGAAQKTGLLEEIFLVVLPTAVANCARWVATGYDGGVSINLPTAIVGSRNLPNQLETFVNEFGLDPGRITFEVTEDGWLHGQDLAREVLTRLRIRGFGLAIDDFGTGYSSVQQLLDAPFNELKIDQTFVRAAVTDPEAAIALGSIATLAHQLELSVVAEGVETLAQWNAAAAAGCDQVQGYFVSRPLPADEFVDWLHSHQPLPCAEHEAAD